VALDKNNRAEGTLYYDDETSYDYQEQELYDYLHFEFMNGVLAVHPRKQNYKQIGFERIYFAGIEATPKEASFFCGTDSKSYTLEIKEDQNAFYVDVTGIECDYNWSITLGDEISGSTKNILGGTMIIILGMLHVIKFIL
jgi:hypothetical protein